jgi:hypothetical protein
MSGTPRFSLPFLSAGQAQKETTHNEALQTLDFAIAAAVLEPPRDDPPADPAIGDCFIVGATPSGGWAGWTDAIAGYSAGGWRRIAPVPGMRVWVESASQWATYHATGWEFGKVRGTQLLLDGQQVVGARGAPIGVPVGGSTIDEEGRASIAAILAALREHGLIAT